MKIATIETLFVRPRWVLVKVRTDGGLVGWGDATLEGWSPAVAGAVAQMADYLVGKDPRRIEHHVQALYRGGFYRGGPLLTSALSGLEQALWDLTGKALGAGVHELLGGRVRGRVRVYAHVGGDSAEAYALAGREKLDAGFTAVKTCPFGAARFVETPAFVAGVVERVQALRDAVGPDVDVALDFHGRTSPALAIRLCQALEPLEPMFVEEPCPPGNADSLAAVARTTSIPIAAGERLVTRWGFRELLEKRAVAICQPDLSHAGGILEVRKIAAVAEVYDVAVAPHCPLSAVSLAAGLQLDACTPNFLCQEQVCLGEGYLARAFVVADGCIDVPAGPGLGIEIDEDALAERLYDGRWANPRLWHDDGSVADW